MSAIHFTATVAPDGFRVNGKLLSGKLPRERYFEVLGTPSRTVDGGSPAPYGYRNNQVHVYDAAGIYLTEHHATGLIESVNFIFDPADSPFQIGSAFGGCIEVDGIAIRPGMPEAMLASSLLLRDLPGEYSLRQGTCWVGISAKGRRNVRGKRMMPRYVVRVSVCPK